MAGTVVLFVEGAFGLAVADRLTRRVERLRALPLIQSAASLDGALEGAGFVAAALWRRCPPEEDSLDAACRRNGVRWTAVVLEDTHLRCGPLIDPSTGPCHACYQARRLTHCLAPERDAAIDAAYASTPAIGVAGFTPSAVGIAVASLLLDRRDTGAEPGRLRHIDLLDCSIEETRVIRVHGCPRCSTPQPPGERYVRDLVRALDGSRP